MSGPSWLVDRTPETHRIYFPGAKDKAKVMRDEGQTVEQIEAFLDEYSFDVELRGLNAGDKAKLDELRFNAEGGAKLEFGANQLAMVEMAVVTWTLPFPADREHIVQLQPEVVAEILAAIPDGRLAGTEIDRDAGKANGSGPPPQAVTVPPAPAREAPTET